MSGKDSSERLLGAILEAAVHAIIVSDAAGVIVRANAAAGRLFGYDAADLVGHPVDRLMPESERPRHSEAIARYLRTGEARVIGIGRDVEGLRADGSLFLVHLSVGHARIDAKDFFVAVLHDLSRRLEAERTLEQAHRLEALGELTGGVAHDFNNLLTVITGNLELLEQSLKGDSRHGLVRDALDAAELGADLTAKLLALARRSVLAPRLVDPVTSVEAALSLLRRTLGPGIELRLNVDGDIWQVRLDPTQFQTALINLALNAQDAMPEGGEITVTLANVSIDDSYLARDVSVGEGRYVRISVTDTGIGMGKEVRRRAFEPFFTTKPTGKGTGLGLSMVYGFTRQSGGHATLYSEPGIGTTVSLYFPAAAVLEAKAEVDAAQGKTPARAPSGEVRVLVVEDDHAVRRLSVSRIEALGYRTLAAGNAAEALAILGTEPGVDVLFADIVMPGAMNGHDLARKVKADYPQVSILLTSGFAGGIGSTAAAEFSILHKPYRQNDLAMRLRLLVSRQRG